MKVAWKVLIANVQVAYVTMENVNYLLSAVAPLGRITPDVPQNNPQLSSDGTNIELYFNIDKTVQGAGDTTAGASTTFTPLDNMRIESFGNLQNNVSVANFQKGVTYLIPVTQFAPINLIPDMRFSRIIAGSGTGGGTIFKQTAFRFDCDEDLDILNGTSITGCITCQMFGANLDAIMQQKNTKRLQEQVSFARAINAGATANVAAQMLLQQSGMQ